MAQDGVQDLMTWYHEIPVISRVYLTAAIGTSTACFMDLISPFTLYYNYDLIVHKQQFWRIFSSFVFLGSFSLDFLFHLYFVVRYCRLLEEGPYRGKRADFLFMLLFGALCMLAVVACTSMFAKMKFLGHPFGLFMTYIWSRWPENVHVRMSLLGLFTFSAPYLPWVILLFSMFIGNPIETDALGIIVGHIFYFLDSIYPQVAEARGWSRKRILVTPGLFHYICGTEPHNEGLLNVSKVYYTILLMNLNYYVKSWYV